MNNDFEMPTPCQKCGEIFDLNDGVGSELWFPNTVICENCGINEKQRNWLTVVKAILVSIGVLNITTTLCAESWLNYYHEGYSPMKAIIDDFEGYTIPPVSYSKVTDIYNQLTQQP